jgi:hypothetical protein
VCRGEFLKVIGVDFGWHDEPLSGGTCTPNTWLGAAEGSFVKRMVCRRSALYQRREPLAVTNLLEIKKSSSVGTRNNGPTFSPTSTPPRRALETLRNDGGFRAMVWIVGTLQIGRPLRSNSVEQVSFLSPKPRKVSKVRVRGYCEFTRRSFLSGLKSLLHIRQGCRCHSAHR